MNTQHRVRLLRSGYNQIVLIPRGFELIAEEVIIRKVGGDLIIKPLKKQQSLHELLASWQPLEINFPEISDITSSL